MSDDQHGEGRVPEGGGRWDPLPQGDYDDGATAFVKLPEGGIDALLDSADSPLAAPGHGYVPPPITVTPATTAGTDPAATGTWAMPSAPVDGAQWQAPEAGQQDPYGQHGAHEQHGTHEQHSAHGHGQGGYAAEGTGQDDQFVYHPGATGHWDFSAAAAEEAAPAPGHDVTGQWSIPVAGGDLPDESGEFTQSSLVEQWGGTPPATLPGGAPAPWATQAPGQPWGEPPAAEDAHAGAPPAEPVTEDAHGGVEAPESPADGPEQPAPAAESDPAREAAEEPLAPAAPERAPEPEVAAEPRRAPESDAEPQQEPEPTPEPEPQPAPEPDAGDGPEDAAAPEPDAPRTEPDPAAEPQETTDEAPAPEVAAPLHEEHPLASYVLRVNGTDRPVTDAWIGESLLYVLRERLGLAGAKDGCSQGECGACNVQVDGRLVASCLVPAVTAAGSEVRTVEGLAADGQPSDVQRALARCGAVQCGFCVPGMAMTVHDLLEGNPAPTPLETRQALCGNLCRCSGYRGVLRAVEEVVAEREAHAAADAGEQDTGEARIPHQAGPGAGGVHASAFESPSVFESPTAFEPPHPPGPPAEPRPQAPHAPHDQPDGQDGGHA